MFQKTNTSIEAQQDLHATICRMTDDSSKNEQLIKTGMLAQSNSLSYQYNLIWCDEDYANKLIEGVKTSNDTKKVVFVVGGSTKRARKKHWINNFKMQIRVLMNDDGFDDDLFDYTPIGPRDDENKRMLIAKYPNYELLCYHFHEIHQDWSDVYDANWTVIEDDASLKLYLGDEYESFDSDLMVFVRNNVTDQSIVLVSDFHSSAEVGKVQDKFIKEWKPSAVSLEMNHWLWRLIQDNKDREHPMSCSLLKGEAGCIALSTLCGALGYKTDSRCVQLATATGICGLISAGRCCNMLSKKMNHWRNAKNMMSVLESNVPSTVHFSEWFYESCASGSGIDNLMTELRGLKDPLQHTKQMSKMKIFEGFRSMLFDSIKDQCRRVKEHHREYHDEDIMSMVRSDIMFQSIMSLSKIEGKEGSKKHTKIVGVYGMSHVLDIKARFEGDSDGFLLDLNN